MTTNYRENGNKPLMCHRSSGHKIKLDRSTFISYLKFIIIYDTFFFTIYFGANAIASMQSYRFKFYWEWEKSIPLIEWMIWPYISLYMVFFVPLFSLKKQDYPHLTLQTISGVIIAGMFFILLPVQSELQYDHLKNSYITIFTFLKNLDKTNNYFPSLHVIISYLILSECWKRTKKINTIILKTWLLLIILSVIFAHQHYILDVISALIIVAMIQHVIPFRQKPTQFPRQ